MSHLLLTLNFQKAIKDPASVKLEPIRAGIHGRLPYVLATGNASWKIPDHFSQGRCLLLVAGGGGAGGDDKKENLAQGFSTHPGENGTSTIVFVNGTPMIDASGGVHGKSAFSNLSIAQRETNGGGLGGVWQTPPQKGKHDDNDKTITAKKQKLLTAGIGGEAGKKLLTSDNYNGIAGGGAGGYIPFGDEQPTAWQLPHSIRGPFLQSASSGSGFGAGGGGTASEHYVPKIGTSGGSYSKVRETYIDYAPGDTIRFEIGKGGKPQNDQAHAAHHGTDGFALLYLQDAPPFFPQELPAPNVQSYSITPVNQTVKSLMEFGTIRQRRVSMQNRLSLQCSWLFTESEFHVFSRWFYHDTKNGAVYFFSRIKTPYEEDNYQFVRFTEPYQAELITAHMWRVRARIEYIENHPQEPYA